LRTSGVTKLSTKTKTWTRSFLILVWTWPWTRCTMLSIRWVDSRWNIKYYEVKYTISLPYATTPFCIWAYSHGFAIKFAYVLRIIQNLFGACVLIWGTVEEAFDYFRWKSKLYKSMQYTKFAMLVSLDLKKYSKSHSENLYMKRVKLRGRFFFVIALKYLQFPH